MKTNYKRNHRENSKLTAEFTVIFCGMIHISYMIGAPQNWLLVNNNIQFKIFVYEERHLYIWVIIREKPGLRINNRWESPRKWRPKRKQNWIKTFHRRVAWANFEQIYKHFTFLNESVQIFFKYYYSGYIEEIVT